MTHKAKPDVWIIAAILFAIAVLLLGGNRWIAGPVLFVLLICAYPESYETTPEGIAIRTSLSRRVIPYEAITFIGPGSGESGALALPADRVLIQYGPASELVIRPARKDAFFADVEAKAPHLIRRGRKLVAAGGWPMYRNAC